MHVSAALQEAFQKAGQVLLDLLCRRGAPQPSTQAKDKVTVLPRRVRPSCCGLMTVWKQPACFFVVWRGKNVKYCCPIDSPWSETTMWVSSLLSDTSHLCARLLAHCEHLAGAYDRETMPHLAKVSFQDWSTSWNMESPRQLDIGGRADFGYPSNSHVMIPKQLRCWKAGDTWGKWLWKIKIIFQPCRHTVW